MWLSSLLMVLSIDLHQDNWRFYFCFVFLYTVFFLFLSTLQKQKSQQQVHTYLSLFSFFFFLGIGWGKKNLEGISCKQLRKTLPNWGKGGEKKVRGSALVLQRHIRKKKCFSRMSTCAQFGYFPFAGLLMSFLQQQQQQKFLNKITVHVLTLTVRNSSLVVIVVVVDLPWMPGDELLLLLCRGQPGM